MAKLSSYGRRENLMIAPHLLGRQDFVYEKLQNISLCINIHDSDHESERYAR